ncbi:MAG: cell division protein SepF [Candidatus Anoxymicrobium japonicum]|uniref:Cell division protein SepF n=1 Tax=Candidatus Anoxymicrobium japonicum TaxID=2013648 RepID=A0A2N3G7L1_9ACTN|nr:MAG: cell division protein SepF [Candidatus Anoxymicrobium japonicum]
MPGFWGGVVEWLGLKEPDEFGEMRAREEAVEEISDRVPRRRGSERILQSVPEATSKVHVIEPKGFNDAEQIGAKFKNDTPVIVNLQSIDRELSRRLIDFVSGLAYGLDGGIQRVAEMVFLLTPASIEVSAEDRKWMREKGFFNQF